MSVNSFKTIEISLLGVEDGKSGLCGVKPAVALPRGRVLGVKTPWLPAKKFF